MPLTVAPNLNIGSRTVSWFQVCASLATALAVTVFAIGARLRHLSIAPLLPLFALTIVSFLSVAMAAKIVVGEERLTYLHHALSIVSVAAVFLRATQRPVLAYLDLVVTALIAFLVIGRIGCFLVGCCHGRPCRHGFAYAQGHVDAGLQAAFGGVRLVPVALFEAVGAAVIVAANLHVLSSAARPGTALRIAAIAYGAARFATEAIRGDVRPALAGLTEAQWTAVGLATTVLVTRSGFDDTPIITALAAGLVIGSAVRVASHRGRTRERRQFRSPAHTAELLAFLHVGGGRTEEPLVIVTTSIGVQLSRDLRADRRHAALSWPGHDLDERDTVWVLRLLASISADSSPSPPTVVPRGKVIHIIEPEPALIS